MNVGVLLRILICILVLGLFLYSYIEKQNDITQLRLEIPAIAKECEKISQENEQLQFQIDQFENPAHLLQLARKPEYSHLKFPKIDEIIIIP